MEEDQWGGEEAQGHLEVLGAQEDKVCQEDLEIQGNQANLAVQEEPTLKTTSGKYALPS